MKSAAISLCTAAILLVGWRCVSSGAEAVSSVSRSSEPAGISVVRGAKWLASVQGHDGGWGQDGGETSYVRTGEHLESSGNDAANTAVAVQALLHVGSTPVAGEYRTQIQRGVRFLLRQVQDSPEEGLAVTRINGTQIQRKLGPFIDTFFTANVLAEVDGTMGDARANADVRRGLEKCVRKIQQNQAKDGSWNLSGGWAPILGTSAASRSLYKAQAKGVVVENSTLARIDKYTKDQMSAETASSADQRSTSRVAVSGGPAGYISGTVASSPMSATTAAAGVPLYARAQALEQLSRTSADREKNKAEIGRITSGLNSASFVSGFGSMGGEEFFSYLNISDSLHRTGGPEWDKWNTEIKARLVKMQNEDGTWAGHHCITGRVAVTSAAVLTLLAERDTVPQQAKAVKR